MQSSLPAGWLAFTGRELNPLDRYKRFQITFSFPFSGFILAQEGPTFISRTVALRRLDRRYSWHKTHSGRWMFGRIFGLDGRESYRELRLEPLCCLTV